MRAAPADEVGAHVSAAGGVAHAPELAGSGTALGATFQQLAALIERSAPAQRHRLGICFDTCHVWVAGYDLAGDYDAVLAEFDDRIGLSACACFIAMTP